MITIGRNDILQDLSTNIALGKPTIQSSTFITGSIKPNGVGVTSGMKSGGFGFHTENEYRPWLVIDLEQRQNIENVVVYNRQDFGSFRSRLIVVSISEDIRGPWSELYRGAEEFGGVLDGSPLVVRADQDSFARYVRLHIEGQETLHLDEIEVYGSGEVVDDTESRIGQEPVDTDLRESQDWWNKAWRWITLRHRYGFAYQSSPHLDFPKLDVWPGEEFDGTVDVIRVELAGHTGNNVFQLLNASMIARTIGCRRLEIPRLALVQDQVDFTEDGLTVAEHSEITPYTARWWDYFYYPKGMEGIIGSYDSSFILETARRFVAPIYKTSISEAGSLGQDTIVMNLRGGDIFKAGPVHNLYVQPPLSFYMCALDHAVRELGVTKVHVVYQDNTNPAVDLLIEELRKNGISFSWQSGGPYEDFSSLLSAHHFVATCSTFSEAAAILSLKIQTHFAFRRTSSQFPLQFWAQDRLQDLLVEKGVRTFVIDDPDKSYIAAGSWTNSPEQNESICDFPVEKLRLMERFGGEHLRKR